jgi:6,7-dimethyl-8-ribityllumazine synthase
MIRSLHKLLVPKNEPDYRALVEFFDALGLARGETWDGRRSKGVKFDAREAGVEIGIGEGFPEADLVIEVDSADAVYEAIIGKNPGLAKTGLDRGTRFKADRGTRRGFKIGDDIADTDWGARIFTVQMPAGTGRLAIFSYKQDWRAANTREGKLDATGLKFAIVVSRFNAFITERLLAGALDGLHRLGAGAKTIEVVRVPGSFEIPAAARALAKTGKYNAILCLGCLIRGETAHYEVIANEVTRGIGQSAQETGVPHAFGVLTCDTLEQAIDRAGLKTGNKGYDAALAAVEMAQLKNVDGRRPTVDDQGIKSSNPLAGATKTHSAKKSKRLKSRAGSKRH